MTSDSGQISDLNQILGGPMCWSLAHSNSL